MNVRCMLVRLACVIIPGTVLAACGGDGAVGPGGGSRPNSPPPPTGPPPPPPIGATLSLQPGEVRVLTDVASIRRFAILAASDAREYHIIVMSTAETGDGTTPIRFRAASGTSANRVPDRGSGLVPSRAESGLRVRPPLQGLSLEDRMKLRPRHPALRTQMLDELHYVGGRPSKRTLGVGTGAVRASRTQNGIAVPNVNDTVRIKSATTPGGGLSCNGNTPIDGVVKTVGDNFVIVEDPAAAGFFTEQDYAELDAEVDDFVAPVDHSYFGTPADLDGNERTIAFFTRQVNRMSEEGSGSIIIGFFTELDLWDPVDCPSSNEAEIIWLIAPDPDGEQGPRVSTGFVKEIARGLIAHEFQHLLNAQQRVTLGTASGGEQTFWVNEGLSHIAEEVSGLNRIALGVRANFGFDDIATGTVERAAFDDFQHGNFWNVGKYLESPTEINPLSGGGFSIRGFGYLFLRWLGDRYGPASPPGILAGSGEDALFRELARGGSQHLSGIANILQAINTVSGESPTWADVLSEYFAAQAVDDAEVSGLPAEVQFSTWNLPKLWEEMRTASISGLSSGYPLATRIIQMGSNVSSTNDFDLLSSTAKYFTLRSEGSHPRMVVETMHQQTSGNVPNGAAARIIVIRTK